MLLLLFFFFTSFKFQSDPLGTRVFIRSALGLLAFAEAVCESPRASHFFAAPVSVCVRVARLKIRTCYSMRSAIYGMCRCVHTRSRRISRCQRACVPLVPVGRVSQRLARPSALLGILANRWLLMWKDTYEEREKRRGASGLLLD